MLDLNLLTGPRRRFMSHVECVLSWVLNKMCPEDDDTDGDGDGDTNGGAGDGDAGGRVDVKTSLELVPEEEDGGSESEQKAQTPDLSPSPNIPAVSEPNLEEKDGAAEGEQKESSSPSSPPSETEGEQKKEHAAPAAPPDLNIGVSNGDVPVELVVAGVEGSCESCCDWVTLPFPSANVVGSGRGSPISPRSDHICH